MYQIADFLSQPANWTSRIHVSKKLSKGRLCGDY